ncbi:MAG: ABC transporter permease, partial [Candidatus Adiutrix sp.]
IAGLASALMAGIHGTVCLVFRGSQVVSGLALTIFGTGLADYLGNGYIGRVTQGFDPFEVPLLASLPVIGEILFKQDALVYLSYLSIPLCWFFLKRTSLGLAIRATGENPAAALASGLNPQRLRWFALLLGGFTIGLGGAYLSLAYTHMWTHTITAGRGWIAVALVIFAFWEPFRAMLGAYLFGGIWVFQLRLQASGAEIPTDLLTMLPYLLTLVVLVISSAFGDKGKSPAALGINLEPRD